MKRVASVAALAGVACSGALVAVLFAAGPAGADEGTTTTTTTTTVDTSTTTAPVTTTTTATTPTTTVTIPTATTSASRPKARKPTVRVPRLITEGVTVGGTLVGGLTVAEARELVRARFERPLALVLSSGRTLRLAPAELGARANFRKALSLAGRVRKPGFVVPLDVAVSPARLSRVLASLGRKANAEPVDAQLRLKGMAPVLVDAKPGRRLKEVVAGRAIRRQLKLHARDPIRLPFEEVRPAVTSSTFRSVIVIQRESKKLHYYVNERLKRTFGVATGQSSYPTPLGRFEIINLQRNPWWYPPSTSDWAQGKEPVPPGPGNPLGTRWMGISSPYVGIHGTPDAASIGYSASHGCIRMLIPEVEWLFERVEIGTPVFIVRA